MQESEQQFFDWLRGSRSVFDVVACDDANLPKSVIRLDRERLDAEIEDAFSERFGRHEIGSALPVVRRISEDFTKRIADEECERLGLHAHGLRNAWFCPIYSEFCSLIPIRILAKNLIKKYEGQIFAIPLPSQKIRALKSWGKDELESFYLAGELRRRNAGAFLYSSELKSPNIRIALSSAWLRKRYPEFKRDVGGTAVLCGRAMRRSDLVVSSAGTSHRQRPSLLGILRFALGARPIVAFDLVPGSLFGPFCTYSAPETMPSLE